MDTTKNIIENKVANTMTSSMLIHPGEMIKDEIIARGMTQKDLAQQMGVSYTVFNEILNGKRPVTTEYALLLEAALGTNASIWIGLQADYNMQKKREPPTIFQRDLPFVPQPLKELFYRPYLYAIELSGTFLQGHHHQFCLWVFFSKGFQTLRVA